MNSLYRSPHDAFKALNLDRGGGISLPELKEWCSNKNVTARKEDIHALFKVLDEDGNGNIGHAEFLRQIAKVRPGQSFRAGLTIPVTHLMDAISLSREMRVK